MYSSSIDCSTHWRRGVGAFVARYLRHRSDIEFVALYSVTIDWQKYTQWNSREADGPICGTAHWQSHARLPNDGDVAKWYTRSSLRIKVVKLRESYLCGFVPNRTCPPICGWIRALFEQSAWRFEQASVTWSSGFNANWNWLWNVCVCSSCFLHRQ